MLHYVNLFLVVAELILGRIPVTSRHFPFVALFFVACKCEVRVCLECVVSFLVVSLAALNRFRADGAFALCFYLATGVFFYFFLNPRLVAARFGVLGPVAVYAGIFSLVFALVSGLEIASVWLGRGAGVA